MWLAEWAGIDAPLGEKTYGVFTGTGGLSEKELFTFFVGFAGLKMGEIVNYGNNFFKFFGGNEAIFEFDNFGNILCVAIFFCAVVSVLLFLLAEVAEEGR